MWLYLSNLQAVQNELEDLQPRTNVKHLNQHQHSDAAVDFWTLWYCLKLMTQQTQKQALRRNNFARVSMKKSDTYKDKVQGLRTTSNYPNDLILTLDIVQQTAIFFTPQGQL